ncbi:ABC transporter substrate-binding protein [Bacillaceae bacterium SIJ1]|uniref:ABC transporter substrate-binding protein n=1 Tax=Litoribacterium kuwaitense TaxID=1398745 RepID=UPI0013ED4FE6|nr:ABC transporter substrate-binding protein [Litoribacterium kuwaitense]NGP45307.1 ABC transporter substrate-binding protein [Litoribacterium kuwaitense]
MKEKIWFILIVAIGLLTGCGSNDPQAVAGESMNEENVAADQENVNAGDSDEKSSDENKSAFPRTISHVKGELTLEEKPQRIASVDIMITDYLLALDETPIVSEGVSTKQRSEIFAEYAEGKDITDLGGKVNMETIVAKAPDVMLMSSESRKVEKYDTFEAIAPTAVIDFSSGVRSRLQQVAELVGKEEKAEEILATFDQKVTQAKSVAEAHSNDTVLFLISNGKDFTVMHPDEFPVYYEEIGLTAPEGLPRAENGRIGIEALTTLAPDHIFIAENRRKMNAEDKLGLINVWQENPVWQGLNAVENHQVYVVDTLVGDTFFLGQVAGVEAIIEHLGE